MKNEDLPESHIEDIKLAAKKMTGHTRRKFQAEMAQKYCNGNARRSEDLFGWGRETVTLGLNEVRSGIECIAALAGRNGKKSWETKYPDAEKCLQEIAEEHSQQDPTFNSTISYTRLTANSAIQELIKRGVKKEELPAPRTMSDILNRMGFRLRKVVKAKPLKKIAETNEIFDNLKNNGGPSTSKKKE